MRIRCAGTPGTGILCAGTGRTGTLVQAGAAVPGGMEGLPGRRGTGGPRGAGPAHHRTSSVGFPAVWRRMGRETGRDTTRNPGAR